MSISCSCYILPLPFFQCKPLLESIQETSNVTPVFLFDFWQWNCRFMAFRQHSALPHVASVITRRNPFRLWKHYISESVNQAVALARNDALFWLLLELYQEWKKPFPKKRWKCSVAVLSQRTRFSFFVFLYTVWAHRNVLAFYCYGVNAFSIDRKIKIRKVRTYI